MAANNLILVDPWWNPAVEEQAIMRIYRFDIICFQELDKKKMLMYIDLYVKTLWNKE